MSIKWLVRGWLAVIVIAAGLTIIALTGCASIQTSDCARNKTGAWVCQERIPR